jgi:hypothetical protein
VVSDTFAAALLTSLLDKPNQAVIQGSVFSNERPFSKTSVTTIASDTTYVCGQVLVTHMGQTESGPTM